MTSYKRMKALIMGAALVAALSLPARADEPANALAVAQTLDCASTAVLLRAPGTFERNPIARAAGASKSLPLCLAESAVLNFAVRRLDRTPSRWPTRLYAGIEAGFVANNAHVLLRVGFKV